MHSMDGITLALITIGITYVFYKLLTCRRTKGKPPPGPRGLPFVGSAFELTLDNIYEKFFEFAKKYGDVFQIQIFRSRNVVLNSSHMIHEAFCGEKYKSYLNNRPRFFFGDYFYQKGQSIVFYENPNEHAHGMMRKDLAKSLHVYGEGMPVFEENVNLEIRRLVEEIEGLQGKEFEVTSLLKKSLSNLMSILLIGKATRKEDAEAFWEVFWSQDFFFGAMTDSLCSSFPFIVHIPGYYKTKYDNATAAREKITERYFRQVKATRKPEAIRGIIDWNLERQEVEREQGRPLFRTDERITNHILELLTAGVVTSMSVLSGVLLCLVNHKECQLKLQEELDNVTGILSIGDRHQCPFTTAVIYECLRLLTPAPFLAPHLCSEDINFEGYEIKKGSIVFPNVWYIHHDEDIWGDPWNFRPERFLDENGEIVPNTHPYRKNLLPFGIGRRQCPGEGLAHSRLFLYVGNLLKTFRLEPSETHCRTCDPRAGQFDRNTTFRPKPFYCRAVNRVSRKV